MTISRNDLKNFSSLIRKSKRNELGLFIVEGKKICDELIQSDFQIERLFVTEKYKNDYKTAELISQNDADRLSNLKNQSDIIGIVKTPKHDIPETADQMTIYLEGISDPGNMGTILRSLDWFGYNNVYCSSDCVDIFNNKAVMASMGSVFRVKSHTISLTEICDKFKITNTIGTTLDGENLYSFQFEEKSIIILGNEANGISRDLTNKVNQNISIPKKGNAESLNVSIATSIILNEINRRTNF